MSPGQDLFKAVLAGDLTHILKNGLHPKIAPGAIPAIAELAEALSPSKNDGQDDYYRQAVEALLRRAIGQLPPEVRDGVVDLLGLNDGERRVGVRMDQAAEHLGFKNGDSLRHSRKPAELLGALVDQLLEFAEGGGFPYAARFILPAAELGRSLDSAELAATRPFALDLLRELRGLFTQGFEASQEKSVTPLLNRLAEALIDGTGSTAEKTEILLRSGIHLIESDTRRRVGIEDVFGIGYTRDVELEHRRDRAAPNLGMPRAGMLRRNQLETPLVVDLKNALLPLVIQAGLVEKPSRQLSDESQKP
jgi:hypothetical protein